MNNTAILKRLYNQYTSKFVIKIILAALLSVLVAVSTSATAWLLDPAIEKIFINKDQTLIILIPFAIILAFTTKGISLYFAKLIMINVGEEVKKIIQIDMLNSFIKADTETIENKHSGNYISNLNFDVQQITRMLSDAFLSLFKDGLTLIGLLVVMFYQNWKLSLIAIIMIPLASITAKVLGKRMGKVSTQAQERSGDLNRYLIDLFKNHKIIKIFQKEIYEKNRAEIFLDKVKEKGKKMAIVFVRASPIMEIMTGIIIAILIYYSGKLVMNDEIEISNFFSFLAAMMLSYQPIRSLATLNMAIYQGVAAAERIFKIIDEKIQIKDEEKFPELKVKNADIKFQDVSFQYKTGKDSAVKKINLNIEGEKITALVGHSGAGKSTIMNLIPRFYQQQSGNILIDSQDITKVSLHSLRSKISLVSQDIILFDDNVENNIKYAKSDATQDEIKNACKLAAADEFIETLPEKYKTNIGENGIRLSGGQKQRLSIARAIIKNAPIILLDEATSSLDAESEEKVQNAIFNLTKNKTTLVIAHRLSTIKKANNIIVMKDGNIVGSGKHDELLKSSKDYESLYSKQVI